MAARPGCDTCLGTAPEAQVYWPAQAQLQQVLFTRRAAAGRGLCTAASCYSFAPRAVLSAASLFCGRVSKPLLRETLASATRTAQR